MVQVSVDVSPDVDCDAEMVAQIEKETIKPMPYVSYLFKGLSCFYI